MKAITIRQPWARAIASGFKDIENRGRPTSHRGLVAIHAGKTIARAADHDPRITAMYGRDASIGVPLGAVIAVADLVDCHPAAYGGAHGRTCCEPWGEPLHNGGPCFHLTLASVRRLATPVPVRGSLALPFTLPDDVATAVAAQLTEDNTSC